MSFTATDSLDRLIEQTGELYSLPRVAVQVLELTRQPTIDAWKLKQCIENDPALTAKLLRVVNSALFGLSRSVSDLNQALAILGTKPLKLLVLGFSLPEGLFEGVASEFLSRYWQRTLIKAIAARELCGHVARVSGDEAFIAALLQDIGTLVLIQHLGGPYMELLETAAASGGDALCLERRTLGFDRTQLTSRLLNHWQLPEAIVAAARLPASSDELAGETAARQPLRQIVYLADLLARVLLDQQPEALQELLEAIRGATSLDEPQLARLVEDLANKVPQLAGVLSLDLPEELNYSELLLRAYDQLAPLAAGAAAELIEARRQAALRQAEELCQSGSAQEVQRRASQWNVGRAKESLEDRSPGISGSAADQRPARLSGQQSLEGERAFQADPQLAGSLTSAIAACRQRRAPVSLVLVQLDQYDELAGRGAAEAEQAVNRLYSICQGLDHGELRCHRLPRGSVSLVLANCERRQAVRLVQQLLDSWRRLADGARTAAWAGTSISIGLAAVALAPRNFPAQELVTSAARCLSGAQSSGGNCFKSIEL
jgi:HD-like signal output (HDOD) protein/GGDEF domain-containing protein